MTSKNLPPRTEPFWPTIFYKTQFCELQSGLPSDLTLSGKVAIITGANAGLGFESAKQLLNLNLSHLILAVRSKDKGEKAALELRPLAPKAKIEVWQLDMCSYASIQAFAEKVDRELPRLDVALLNAGLVKQSFELVKESGHEETMQVNYLSTVLLTLLLLPLLRKKKAPNGDPGKISIVNSGLSLTGKLPLDKKKPDQGVLASFDDPKHFSNTTWYSTSKTLMHLFLWKLEENLPSRDVIVNAVDPGYVKGTAQVRDMPGIAATAARMFAAVTGRTVEVGASTYVDAVAVKGEESHCCFVTSWRIHPFLPLLYTPEGKKLIEQLWGETMKELAFANPEGILSTMGSKDV